MLNTSYAARSGKGRLFCSGPRSLKHFPTKNTFLRGWKGWKITNRRYNYVQQQQKQQKQQPSRK